MQGKQWSDVLIISINDVFSRENNKLSDAQAYCFDFQVICKANLF